MSAVSAAVRTAYSASAAAWAGGPSRVYDRMAEVLIARSPVSLTGRIVLDIGSGTGAAARAIRAAGGRPVAVDAAAAMATASAGPAVLADATRLPVRSNSVGATVAAFCLNHLDQPEDGLREAERVTARGGAVLASSYGVDDHPVKAAVERALVRSGYVRPAWYDAIVTGAVAQLQTATGMARAAHDAGMAADVLTVDVAFPELGAAELVAWRLGMAHIAPHVALLDPAARERVLAEALDRLGEPYMLVRRMIVLTAVV